MVSSLVQIINSEGCFCDLFRRCDVRVIVNSKNDLLVFIIIAKLFLVEGYPVEPRAWPRPWLTFIQQIFRPIFYFVKPNHGGIAEKTEKALAWQIVNLHIKFHKFIGSPFHLFTFHNQISSGFVMCVHDVASESLLPGSKNLSDTGSDRAD